MIVPDQDDPRWRALVAGSDRIEFDNLAVRMLVARLRLRTLRGDEPSILEAIDKLEGKRTGDALGPFTFGEIAWMLLNQTLVYLTLVTS